jgi:ankyrin repeat protein
MVNQPTEQGTTPLIMAASETDVDTVRILLENGADPTLNNSYGNALDCAAHSGLSENIRLLLDYCSKLSATDACECTLVRDQVDALKTLIARGAELGEKGSDDQASFLYLAISSGARNIVGWLIRERDFNVEACVEDSKYTPLMYAAAMRDAEMVRVLLALNADEEAITDDSDRAFLRQVKSRAMP